MFLLRDFDWKSHTYFSSGLSYEQKKLLPLFLKERKLRTVKIIMGTLLTEVPSKKNFAEKRSAVMLLVCVCQSA